MMNEEDEQLFDHAVEQQLMSYVYALIDPRDRRIFYIGKGGGNAGDGNDRPLHHLDEARFALNNPTVARSAKVNRILEIWETGENVEWCVVRHGLENDISFHVEAALIDLLEISVNGSCLNVQRGHGGAEHGLLDRQELQALAATPVNPNENSDFLNLNIFVFPIQRALDAGATPYEATRATWVVGKEFIHIDPARAPIAVGVSRGIVRGAFYVQEWNQAADGKRWEFRGNSKNDTELLNRNFVSVIDNARGYWLRGNFLIVQFNGNGQVRVVRGSQNREWQDL